MQNEHLTYFKVENFKCFDSLELTDIGQFNLIVGDNNVGKTSLLEALSVYDKPVLKGQILVNRIDLLQNLVGTNRGQIGFKFLAKYDQNPINFTFNKLKVTFIHTSTDQKIIVRINGTSYENILESSSGSQNKNFIPSSVNFSDSATLVRLYSNVVINSVSNKDLIIESLKVIDSNITGMETLTGSNGQTLMLALKNRTTYAPVSTVGEGMGRTLYYLLNLVDLRNGILLIDEIETGIHYSRLKSFLKIILQIAIKNEVQLFMTTHSLECQQAFVEVFEEQDMQMYQERVRQYSLIHSTKEKKVIALGRGFQQLENALETGFETRGGVRKW
jgi:AAA15 family ATPase/GTPase